MTLRLTILILVFLVTGTPPVVALNNGMDLVPPMGWTTWESAGCNINEDLIKRSADAMVAKGLAAAGYTVVGIDDCWAQLERNATGHLVARPELFPNGMRAVADYLHARGLKLRLYSSAGTRTCQGNMSGSLGYEWIDAQTFADMGADALKYDDCYAPSENSVLEDAPKRFPFEQPPILRYPIMGQALNKTGRNISYMCNFPWDFWKGPTHWPANGGKWVAEVCNSWRTGSDARAGFAGQFATVHTADDWAKLVPSGPGAWNQLDALEIGNNKSYLQGPRACPPYPCPANELMTEGEEHTLFSLYAIAKAPLMIGADVIKLAGTSLDTYLNKEVIAVSQDPLGVRGRLIQTTTPLPRACELWSVQLADGGCFALLLNRQRVGSPPAHLSVSWSDVGLQATGKYHVRDVWKHADLGTFSESFGADVEAGSCIAVRVQATTARGVISV